MPSKSKTAGESSQSWCCSSWCGSDETPKTTEMSANATMTSDGNRRLGGMSAVPRYNSVEKFNPFAGQLWAQKSMVGLPEKKPVTDSSDSNDTETKGDKQKMCPKPNDKGGRNGPVDPQADHRLDQQMKSHSASPRDGAIPQRATPTKMPDVPKFRTRLETFGNDSGMSTWDEKQKLDNAADKAAREEAFNKLSKSHQEEFYKLCCAANKKEEAMKGTDAFKEAKQAIERLERTQQYTEAKKANEDFRAFGLKMKKEYNLKVDLSQIVNKAEVEAEQERLEAERKQREKCHDKVRRRLFGAREAPKPGYRFAGTAIPESYEPRRLAEVDVEIPTDAPQITHEGQSTMLSLGMVSGALVCAACVVKRYYQSLKTQARKVSTGLTELVVQ